MCKREKLTEAFIVRTLAVTLIATLLTINLPTLSTASVSAERTQRAVNLSPSPIQGSEDSLHLAPINPYRTSLVRPAGTSEHHAGLGNTLIQLVKTGGLSIHF